VASATDRLNSAPLTPGRRAPLGRHAAEEGRRRGRRWRRGQGSFRGGSGAVAAAGSFVAGGRPREAASAAAVTASSVQAASHMHASAATCDGVCGASRSTRTGWQRCWWAPTLWWRRWRSRPGGSLASPWLLTLVCGLGLYHCQVKQFMVFALGIIADICDIRLGLQKTRPAIWPGCEC